MRWSFCNLFIIVLRVENDSDKSLLRMPPHGCPTSGFEMTNEKRNAKTLKVVVVVFLLLLLLLQRHWYLRQQPLALTYNKSMSIKMTSYFAIAMTLMKLSKRSFLDWLRRIDLCLKWWKKGLRWDLMITFGLLQLHLFLLQCWFFNLTRTHARENKTDNNKSNGQEDRQLTKQLLSQKGRQTSTP